MKWRHSIIKLVNIHYWSPNTLIHLFRSSNHQKSLVQSKKTWDSRKIFLKKKQEVVVKVVSHVTGLPPYNHTYTCTCAELLIAHTFLFVFLSISTPTHFFLHAFPSCKNSLAHIIHQFLSPFIFLSLSPN